MKESILKHVATTARLELTEEEAQKLSGELKEVLDVFATLKEIDTTGVQPSFQPIPIHNVTREDEPRPCLSQDVALRDVKNKKDGYFKGPRAI